MRALIAMALAVLSVGASGQVLRGVIVHVEDGDTLTMRIGSDDYKIRLADIDAPETCHRARDKRCRRAGQAGGNSAKLALEQASLHKVAEAQCRGSSHQRTVCYVAVSGRDLSMLLVESGHAWYDPKHGRRPTIAAAARQAKSAKLGLWGAGEPVPPWVWRANCWTLGDCPLAEN